jgi:hypothetical protein
VLPGHQLTGPSEEEEEVYINYSKCCILFCVLYLQNTKLVCAYVCVCVCVCENVTAVTEENYHTCSNFLCIVSCVSKQSFSLLFDSNFLIFYPFAGRMNILR